MIPSNGFIARPGRLRWLALGALLAIITLLEPQYPLPLDATVQHWLSQTALAQLHGFWAFVSWIGNEPETMVLTLSVISIALWIAGHRRAALILPLILLAAVASNMLLKVLIARPRPNAKLDMLFGPDQFSFPSGHVVQYVCLFGFLSWWGYRSLSRRFVKVVVVGLAAGMVALVGPSRMYLDSHWLSDVIAGYLHGFLWLRAGVLVILWREPALAFRSSAATG